MAIKTVVLLVGLALASVHLAEAQQPKKVAPDKIRLPSLQLSRLALRLSGRACASLGTSKGKTLSSKGDPRGADAEVDPSTVEVRAADDFDRVFAATTCARIRIALAPTEVSSGVLCSITVTITSGTCAERTIS